MTTDAEAAAEIARLEALMARNTRSALRATAMAEEATAMAESLAAERDKYRDAVRALMAAIRIRLGGVPQGEIADPLSAAYARCFDLVGPE